MLLFHYCSADLQISAKYNCLSLRYEREPRQLVLLDLFYSIKPPCSKLQITGARWARKGP
jgi:hypothetical protein